MNALNSIPMSRSLIQRISPFFIARIKQNHKLLSSSFSSSSSALHEASSESPSPSLDAVHMTDNCIKRMKELQASEQSSDHKMLRLSVETGGCSGFQYVFDLDDKTNPDDRVFVREGVKLVVDDISYDFVKGATIDYVEELIRSAFVVTTNPSAVGGCSCKRCNKQGKYSLFEVFSNLDQESSMLPKIALSNKHGLPDFNLYLLRPRLKQSDYWQPNHLILEANAKTMKMEVTMFFKQLLATADSQITGCTKNLLKKLLQCSPSVAVTEGFRKNAIFEMNGEKAPSSDGYAAHLFQVAWTIVKAGVSCTGTYVAWTQLELEEAIKIKKFGHATILQNGRLPELKFLVTKVWHALRQQGNDKLETGQPSLNGQLVYFEESLNRHHSLFGMEYISLLSVARKKYRLFKQVESTAEVIIGGIKESGKLRLTRAGRVAASRINLQLCEAWGLSDV
ncbi:hypothetical protein PVK06_001927 [Gossypium arboreum]|uniref:Core domain-containing protein n=1 Tax=Gossypium arboreum TaxID=29729 RepID=A0ABR0R3F4_GOSAR|nr:hypothetical protein PVK06_001927 [Gossypium arboreum]